MFFVPSALVRATLLRLTRGAVVASALTGALAGVSIGPLRAADEPAASPEFTEAAELVRKAPLILVMATAQYQKEKKAWPTRFSEISHMVEANKRVLPAGFSFRSVTFTARNRKECAVGFAFDWPTLEGGRAAGTITMTAGGSLAEMVKRAQVDWAQIPKLRPDLRQAPAAPAPAAPQTETPAQP